MYADATRARVGRVHFVEDALAVDEALDSVALRADAKPNPFADRWFALDRVDDLDPVRILDHERETSIVVCAAGVPLELIERSGLLTKDETCARVGGDEPNVNRCVEILRAIALPMNERAAGALAGCFAVLERPPAGRRRFSAIYDGKVELVATPESRQLGATAGAKRGVV